MGGRDMWLGAWSVRELSLTFSPTDSRRVRGLPFFHLQELLDHVPTRLRSTFFMYLSATCPQGCRHFRVKYHEWVHALRSLMQVYDQAKHYQRVSVQTAAL